MLLYLVAAMRPTPKQWEEMGGVSMKLHLATWPEGYGYSRNPQSRFVSGTEQYQGLMKLHPAAPTSNYDIDGSSRNNMAPAIPTIAKNGMKLRILLSYHYYKDTDLDALFAKYFTAPYPEVFADSGAFSAASQGAYIDIADYAAWVKRWAHLLTVHSNLDVIGDAAATDRNQKTLEDMGLDPLPVFHTGSDMAHLDALLDRYQYIALGGMVPYMRFPKRIMPWLIKCFKLAQGRAVFHGFGATSWTVVKSFPWYSVDSS